MHKLERPTEPTELQEARNQYRGTPSQDEVWRNFNKDRVRESLKNTQNGLCAYCEMKLSDETRIDHFKPKRLDYRLTFDWNNLVLSCDAKDSCDSKKGGKFEEYWVNPYINDPAGMFRFYSDGQIVGTTEEANKIIEDFGLNSPSLEKKREGILTALQKNLMALVEFPEALEYFLQEEAEMFPTAYKQIIDKISGE